jgi:hypothetical protein
MKLLCVNTNNILPGQLQIGIQYKLKQRWNSIEFLIAEINGKQIDCILQNFEGIKDRFFRLCKTSEKVIFSKPGNGYTVALLLTNNYLIIYSHSKGNNYNVWGNHFKYYHDINTGEFITEDNVNLENEKQIFLKERLLIADHKKYLSIIKNKNKY